MKKYTIRIDDDLSNLFEIIAETAGRTTEDVLADTLYKMVGIILRELDKE